MKTELEKINEEISKINAELPLPRFFVINNEETFESEMYMRTNGLNINFINNFCIQYGLSYDSNNQQILIMQTIVRGKRK